MRDPGRDTNHDLVEIRTVLSRAETALAFMTRRTSWGTIDPDRQEMIAILEEFSGKLSKWRRTGRPLKEKK